MTIANTVAFSSLQNEFGGSNPISLSEYYRGGGIVRSLTQGNNGYIPTSGSQLSISDLRGASKYSWYLESNNEVTCFTSSAINTADDTVWAIAPGGTIKIGVDGALSVSQNNFGLTTDGIGINSHTATTLKSSNVYIALRGVSTALGSGDNTIFYKYTTSGTEVFRKKLSGFRINRPFALTTDSSENVYLGGFYSDASSTYTTGVNIPYFTKIASDGSSVLYQKFLNLNQNEAQCTHGLATDSSDNLYVAIGTTGYVTTTPGAWLLKYNSSGTLQWSLKFSDFSLWDVVVDSSNNVYTCGTNLIYKFNSSGTLQWCKSFNSASPYNSLAPKTGLFIKNVGGTDYLYFTSSHGTGGTPSYVAYFAKIDLNGNLIWVRALNTPKAMWGNSIRVTSNNDVVITGSSLYPNYLNMTGYICKIPAGEINYQQNGPGLGGYWPTSNGALYIQNAATQYGLTFTSNSVVTVTSTAITETSPTTLSLSSVTAATAATSNTWLSSLNGT